MSSLTQLGSLIPMPSRQGPTQVTSICTTDLNCPSPPPSIYVHRESQEQAVAYLGSAWDALRVGGELVLCTRLASK